MQTAEAFQTGMYRRSVRRRDIRKGESFSLKVVFLLFGRINTWCNSGASTVFQRILLWQVRLSQTKLIRFAMKATLFCVQEEQAAAPQPDTKKSGSNSCRSCERPGCRGSCQKETTCLEGIRDAALSIYQVSPTLPPPPPSLPLSLSQVV